MDSVVSKTAIDGGWDAPIYYSSKGKPLPSALSVTLTNLEFCPGDQTVMSSVSLRSSVGSRDAIATNVCQNLAASGKRSTYGSRHLTHYPLM